MSSVSLPGYSLALLPNLPKWKKATLKALSVLHKHSELVAVIKAKFSSIMLPLSEIFVTAIKRVTCTQHSHNWRNNFRGSESFSPVLSGLGMETRKKDL